MDTGLQWLAIIGVINSVVSAYYYLRVVKVMFSDSDSTTTSRIRLEFGTLTAAIIGLIGNSTVPKIPFTTPYTIDINPIFFIYKIYYYLYLLF